MAFLKILSGDFDQKAGGTFYFGCLTLVPIDAKAVALIPHSLARGRKTYSLKRGIVSLELADGSTVPRPHEHTGGRPTGVQGASLLGKLLNTILGAHSERVVFEAQFKDGKKLVAECSRRTWDRMRAVRAHR